MPRCAWAGEDPLYVAYHDDEWGRPITDDRAVFEKLSLEAFQSGLSWLTILRKRERFREAFSGFDPERVAAFDSGDVRRLLADAGIVRNRAKIEATISNARAVLALDRGLGEVLWSHAAPVRSAPNVLAELPSTTAESTALAKTLKRAGFRFVGPTTAYAAMQSLGVVNDHVAECDSRARCETEQQAVRQRLGIAA